MRKATGTNYAASVEQVARIVGVVALLLYVTGLIAVNGYLPKFGVSDFSLLRTRFVYTGGWILTTILASNALFFGLMIPGWEIAKHRESTEGVVLSVLVFLSLAMAMVFVVNMFQWFLDIGRQTSVSFWPLSREVFPAAIVVGAAVVLGYLLFRLLKEVSLTIREQQKLGPMALAWVVVYSALAVAFFGFYIGIFMDQAYPRIPSQLGGGRPHEVRLLVVKEGIPAARELGLSFPSKGQLSNPALLLYESDQQYVLRLPGNRVAVINKSLVSGLTS
jgi:hypothetical protein